MPLLAPATSGRASILVKKSGLEGKDYPRDYFTGFFGTTLERRAVVRVLFTITLIARWERAAPSGEEEPSYRRLGDAIRRTRGNPKTRYAKQDLPAEIPESPERKKELSCRPADTAGVRRSEEDAV